MCQREARVALGWPTDGLLAVHTGNMGTKQGLENIVKAARFADEQCAPIRFVLVGDGSERARLEEFAQGIERIRFVDPLNDGDYRCALAAADCLVVNELPGVATMSVPSKLTSYFDAGRPVLAATDPEGITAEEIRMSKAGVVVPAGDPAGLLAAALQLSTDSETASAYGCAGRRYRSEHLNADAAVVAFEQVIQDLAAQRAHRAPYSSRPLPEVSVSAFQSDSTVVAHSVQ
jgi:colanic acid biosynthesis glycosyl transferase WcaI